MTQFSEGPTPFFNKGEGGGVPTMFIHTKYFDYSGLLPATYRILLSLKYVRVKIVFKHFVLSFVFLRFANSLLLFCLNFEKYSFLS